VREALEETGLAVLPVDVYAFRCDADGDVVAPVGDEIAEVAWADPDALPIPMTNIVAAAVPDAVAGNRGIVRALEGTPERYEPLPATT
jgi:8-oxo-dGTP pyrophosphatase MutT (NUDIX family)